MALDIDMYTHHDTCVRAYIFDAPRAAENKIVCVFGMFWCLDPMGFIYNYAYTSLYMHICIHIFDALLRIFSCVPVGFFGAGV